MAHSIYHPAGLSAAEFSALLEVISVFGRNWKTSVMAFWDFDPTVSLEIPVDHHSALESLGERMSSDDLDRIVLTEPVATMAAH